jgi:hypothetical protein
MGFRLQLRKEHVFSTCLTAVKEPYKRVISNLEGNFERFHKYGLIPSLLKFLDLHTVLIVVNTLMVTFK